MACDCIAVVNEKLAEHNTVLTEPIVFGGGPARLMIVTEKLNPRERKRPAAMFASYCPFCGERVEETRSTC